MVLRTVIRETSDASHLTVSPVTVQVKVTVSIGHGLSTLTEYWANKYRKILRKHTVDKFLTNGIVQNNNHKSNCKSFHCVLVDWSVQSSNSSLRSCLKVPLTVYFL